MPSEQMITRDFDRLLAQYPGFFKELLLFVDDIRQYGTIKQAINDTGLKLEKMRQEVAAAEAANVDRLGALDIQFAAKQAEYDGLNKARAEEISNMIVAAKLDAENIKAAGTQSKNAILSEAKAIAADIDKRAKDARLLADNLETDIKQKREAVTDLDAAIAQKQAALDKIEAARQALVAKIAS